MESHALHRHLVVRSRAPEVLRSPPAARRLAAPRARCRGALGRSSGAGAVRVHRLVERVGSEDFSNDSLPVDYMGLPLTEEGRARALTYSESQLAMIEHQCEAWPPTYLATGAFGLRVSRDTEPIKGADLSYTIGAWSDRAPTVIWMDGRPHPSKYALAHAQRVHDRPLGGKHARHLHDAHEDGQPPQDRPADQRRGDDDDAVLPSRRPSSRCCRSSKIPSTSTEPMSGRRAIRPRRRRFRRRCWRASRRSRGRRPAKCRTTRPDKNPFIDEMSQEIRAAARSGARVPGDAVSRVPAEDEARPPPLTFRLPACPDSRSCPLVGEP